MLDLVVWHMSTVLGKEPDPSSGSGSSGSISDSASRGLCGTDSSCEADSSAVCAGEDRKLSSFTPPLSGSQDFLFFGALPLLPIEYL